MWLYWNKGGEKICWATEYYIDIITISYFDKLSRDNFILFNFFIFYIFLLFLIYAKTIYCWYRQSRNYFIYQARNLHFIAKILICLFVNVGWVKWSSKRWQFVLTNYLRRVIVMVLEDRVKKSVRLRYFLFLNPQSGNFSVAIEMLPSSVIG